eukprot:XP_001699494.1 predicted protein [Chlamydomonas reinhardtii]
MVAVPGPAGRSRWRCSHLCVCELGYVDLLVLYTAPSRSACRYTARSSGCCAAKPCA